ncbi:hypothetical protein HUU62_22350 [Rhodoferax sp. 4810]|nr:hypothetical protein [Rhodoferax jenense]
MLNRTQKSIEKNKARRNAVNLYLAGENIEEIARQCTLSINNVSIAIKNYIDIGWEAVEASGQGGTGRARKLNPNQELKLQSLIRSHLPVDLGLDGKIWSRGLVAELITKVTNVELDRRSVDAFVIRWGYSFPKAYKYALSVDPENTKLWFDNDYRSLTSRATRESALLRWIVIRPIFSLQNILKSVITELTHNDASLTVQEPQHFVLRVENNKNQGWVVLHDMSTASISNALDDIIANEDKRIFVFIVNTTSEALHLSKEYLNESQNKLEVVKIFGKTSTKLKDYFDNKENLKLDSEGISVTQTTDPNSNIIYYEMVKNHAAKSNITIKFSDKVFINDGILFIKKTDGINEGDEYFQLNLRDCWLPPTSFSTDPTKLSMERDLCGLLIACLVDLGRRSRWSKSTYIILTAAARDLIKFFEWSWLHGIYDPMRLTEAHFIDLANQLSVGGWHNALNIDTRIENLVKGKTIIQLESYLTKPKSRKSMSVDKSFQAALGSNISSREIGPSKRILFNACGRSYSVVENISSRAKVTANFGMISSGLRQIFSTINLLAEIDSDKVLKFHPYRNPKKLAEKIGRVGHRTPTLTPDKVGDLLISCMREIRHTAPILIKVITEYISAAYSSDSGPTKFKFHISRLQACPSYSILERHLGKRILRVYGTSIDASDEISLNQVIFDVYTSAIVIIIFLNARRKDEVQHKKVGLYAGSLRLFDERLSLYWADFYVEKSIRDFVTFFVSDFTVESIQVLENLSRLAREWRNADHLYGESARGVSSLMEFPNLSEVGRLEPFWFEIDSNTDGRSRQFLINSIGEKNTNEFGLHVGRRAYALIFHYRYENASLIALAQQFGASSVERVLTYVTDGELRPGGTRASAFGPVTSARSHSNAIDLLDLEKELETVSVERVRELVEKILIDKQRRGGGFSKLLHRFHQKIFGLVDFDLQSTKEKAGKLADILINKGHRTHPAPHGNCLAAPGRRNVGARCSGNDKGELHRENASLEACTNCLYHDFTAGHFHSTQTFMEHQRQQLRSFDGDSIKARTLKASIDNAEIWLAIRLKRLGTNP